MMTSLFSMFDPTAMFNLQLNWFIMLLLLILLPFNFWKTNSRIQFSINFIMQILNKEFKALFESNLLIRGTTLIPIMLFLIIFLNNMISNFPYTFCCNAHLAFTLYLSIPIWLSIVLYFWMNLSQTMFAHLVPTGTPTLLMPLMVLIEITSNLIRPMALSVRLTANLIAGHLLMTLLGNNFNPNNKLWSMILILQILFLMFELMVGMIQSYVFSVLMTLYSSEIS